MVEQEVKEDVVLGDEVTELPHIYCVLPMYQ